MQVEMEALEKNNTWDLVELSDWKKPVGCKWVFTVKYNWDGSLERYKARLVAKGYTQTVRPMVLIIWRHLLLWRK